MGFRFLGLAGFAITLNLKPQQPHPKGRFHIMKGSKKHKEGITYEGIVETP